MSDFLIYLGQSSLCLVALYLIYKVAMSNETLHRFNRVVLLSMLPLSALLPLCRIKIVKVVDLASQQQLADTAALADNMVGADNLDYMVMLNYVLAVVFLLGVIFMLVRLTVSILSVWHIISSYAPRELADGVSLTVVDSLPTPFSWFNHVVVAKSDMAECRDMILTHELAHVRLRHSCDIMIIDLALCVWWFNPALWLLRRELQSLHEYQADEAVLNRGVDAKTYQMMLIKRAVGSRLHSVANCLNHSNLKNRITMMCKKSSSRWSAAKALLVLPMVAIALGAFATTVYLPREVQVKVTENSSNEQVSEGSVIRITSDKIFLNDKQISLNELKGALADYFADAKAVTIQADMDVNMGSIADVKNVLRGVNGLKINYQSAEPTQAIIEQEQTSDKLNKKPTFQGGGVEKFAAWVQSNVKYPEAAEEKILEGRVMFSFTVDKDGSVGSFKVLRSPHDLLSKEVERVFNLAPKWEPGVVDGKKVPVKYIIPIVFKVDIAKLSDDVASQPTPEDKQPAVIIDGKKFAYKKMDEINPNDIDHIDVVKSHGKNGTIYITTKNAKKDKEKVGVVIGGMEVPEYQLEMLDPSQISSMSVVQSAGGGTTIYVNTNDGQ